LTLEKQTRENRVRVLKKAEGECERKQSRSWLRVRKQRTMVMAPEEDHGLGFLSCGEGESAMKLKN
jgi:hypothetical protein